MKLISNQISPNLNAADVICSIFSSGKNIDKKIEKHFRSKNYLLANTARTCLGVVADVVDPPKDKKIGLPAFICAVVATPFLERGYEIEWIDTDKNGVIDIKDFEKKSDNISLLVAPHIFGQEAPLKQIMTIARPKNIFVIEDGAHCIRQLQPGFKEIADVQILSFGREKVVSCVSGGALIWPESSPYAEKFSEVKLLNSSFLWTIRHLSQPIIFSLALPWWNAGGKIIPFVFRKINWLPLAVTPSEKHGREDMPQTTLAPISKKLLTQQFEAYGKNQIHAQALALKWQVILKNIDPKLEVIRPENAFRVIAKNIPSPFRSKITNQTSLNLADWNGVPISPKGVDLEAFGYKLGQCPHAENIAKNYLTFPTNKRVVKRDLNAFAKIWQDA